jgi:hypothetical protein
MEYHISGRAMRSPEPVEGAKHGTAKQRQLGNLVRADASLFVSFACPPTCPPSFSEEGAKAGPGLRSFSEAGYHPIILARTKPHQKIEQGQGQNLWQKHKHDK